MAHNKLEGYVEANALGQRALSRDGFLSIDGISPAYEKLSSLLPEEKGEVAPEDKYDYSINQKMWTKDYIGLYAHYAGVGINGGIQGLILNFCVYYFHGSSSLCPNASSIIFLPWSFKIIYAILTDSFRPFGLRRKPFLIAGWIGVLFFTLLLAILAPTLGSSMWILLSMCTMIFLMLADVPADGYSVELGHLEPPETRGQILATGQRIRFLSTMFAGIIQAFLVNGPETNPKSCPIDWEHCWSWGLTVGQYYGLIFAILLVLFIPILNLQEPDPKLIPQRTFLEHSWELWETLKNMTTLSLLIYVTGSQIFGGMINIATTYMQYYVIGLTNMQGGIDSITTSLAIVIAIYIFQTYLINKNWRTTQYLTTLFTSMLGLQWLLVFYNINNLRNGWFTIFIDTNQTLSAGITQVLFAMAVIELAKPGQEATTYEMVVSVSNAASTINSIIATQLLQTVHATVCNADLANCPADTVNTSSVASYLATNGPHKFMYYTFLILTINIVGTFLFTPFLPKQKEECHEWRIKGMKMIGLGNFFGISSIILALLSIVYGILCSVMLMNPATSCMKIFGGSGC